MLINLKLEQPVYFRDIATLSLWNFDFYILAPKMTFHRKNQK